MVPVPEGNVGTVHVDIPLHSQGWIAHLPNKGISYTRIRQGRTEVKKKHLKGLSHEIDFENVDENGQIFASIRAAAGF